MKQKINRREILTGIGALSAAGVVNALSSPPSPELPVARSPIAQSPIDFDNDAENTRAYAKLAGTIEDGSVYYWSKGTIYGVTHDATKPMVGWTALLKMVWRNLGNGSFHFRNFDLAYFTEPGSDDRIDEFVNPFTGKTNYPLDVKGGPFDVVVSPKHYDYRRMGDDIWFAEPNHFRFKNKLDPKEWPLASSGEMLNMLYIDGFQGKVSDLENPDIVSAPSQISINHVNPWYPFFLMGKQEGVNYWHGQGKKVIDLSEVSPKMIDYCKKKVPDFFESDTPWPTRLDSYLDYKNHRKPIKE